MRLLLDECVDWRLLRDLHGHEVKTVRQMGWNEIVNGALLRLAEPHFDVFVTIDANLSFQQNVPVRELGVVVLHGRTTRLAHLRELVPALLKLLPDVRNGEVHHISWRDLA